MKKPTGTSGPFIVQVQPDGMATGSFAPISLPNGKAEIQLVIAERFIASMNKYLGTNFLSNPVPNPEDEFDFTVCSPRGIASLELMEVAPLAGPYETASHNYNACGFARSIFQGILEKSQRYAHEMANDLLLLIYVTHWAFALDELVIACLRHWCAKTPLAFTAVFSFQSLDEQDGTPRWISPWEPDPGEKDFDPDRFRGVTVHNLDPRNWVVRH
jgi:hypothetical protein